MQKKLFLLVSFTHGTPPPPLSITRRRDGGSALSFANVPRDGRIHLMPLTLQKPLYSNVCEWVPTSICEGDLTVPIISINGIIAYFVERAFAE